MPDITAELELQFGVVAQPLTFVAEVDSRDAHMNKPIDVTPLYAWHLYTRWTEDEMFEYFKDKNVLEVVGNGHTHVRVYAPLDYDIDLITTDPPVDIAGKPGYTWQRFLDVNTGWNLRSFSYVPQPPVVMGARAPVAAPPEWTYVGVYEDIIHDTITFNNQRIAYMKYNYVKIGFEVAFLSKFIRKDGTYIAPPVWYPDLNGAFVASEPCTGSMVLRYPVQYRLFKVTYGMMGGNQWPRIQLAWLNGNIEYFPIPPILVMALSTLHGRASETSFRKQVFPQGAWPVNVGKIKTDVDKPEADRVLSEKERTTEDVVVTDPTNPSASITVQRAKTVVLQDKDGRSWTWKLGS